MNAGRSLFFSNKNPGQNLEIDREQLLMENMAGVMPPRSGIQTDCLLLVGVNRTK
jgi:hypothetical protein